MEDGLGKVSGKFRVILTSRTRKDGPTQMILMVLSKNPEEFLILSEEENGHV